MLGVYLMHPAVTDGLAQQMVLARKVWNPSNHQLWYAIPVMAVIIYLISVLVTLVMQETPLVKRLV
jgi:surface polysaccharide O-acyltransferase-like enzyme